MDGSPLLTVEALASLLTLTALEIVLGIDNIIFIAILVAKLPKDKQEKTRRIGLLAAMAMRIGLLLCITWIMKLTRPLFGVFGQEFTGKDLILLVGGLFLIAKATFEIHEKLEGAEDGTHGKPAAADVRKVLVQIMLLDMVFSLDSVITAVGMANQIPIMIAAVLISVGVMMVFAKPVADFVETRPTLKMLALSFLLLIGFTLVLEGFHQHVSKGYVYAAMGFSLFVEFLNLRLRKRVVPVHLRNAHMPEVVQEKATPGLSG